MIGYHIDCVAPLCVRVHSVFSACGSIWGSVGDDNTRTITAGQAATHIYAAHIWEGSTTHDLSINTAQSKNYYPVGQACRQNYVPLRLTSCRARIGRRDSSDPAQRASLHARSGRTPAV